MGFVSSDFTSTNPTTTTPPGRATFNRVFQVARTETASTLKQVLPARSSVVGVYIYGSTVSNAATTATVTITISDNSGVLSTGSYDVKTNGALTGMLQMTNLPNLDQVPSSGDLKITAQYAETGTASTLGGPWKFRIAYVQ